MKNRIFTNNIRNIKKSLPRFLTLLIMGALGVFAFAGLLATAPDMINSLDRYLDDSKAYDIRVISTLGLDPEDEEALEKLPSIERAEGAYYRDCHVILKGEEAIVNISSLPEELNRIELLSGRLPAGRNEAVVEENLLKQNNMQIGDTFRIDDEEGFYEAEVAITGTVRSPLFYNAVNIDADRGVTNIGAGEINYYVYAPGSNFKADYLSVLYATVKGAEKEVTGSEPYKKLIEGAIDEIEGIKGSREKSRYENVMKLGDDKINDEAAKAQTKLDDAKKQLDSVKKQLDDASKKITDGRKELDDIKSRLSEAYETIEAGETELTAREKDYEEGKRLLEEGGRQLGEKEAQLKEAESLLASGLAVLNEKQAELEEGKKTLSDGKKLLDEKQAQADEGAALIAAGEKELANGEEELNKGKREAEAGRKELEEKEAQAEDAQKQLEEGRKQLEEGKKQLDSAKEALSTARTEYDTMAGSEHLTEDIIESERQRLSKDIEAVRGVLDKLIEQFRAGTLTIESARAVITEAVSAYKREPTVLEKLVFYRVAIEILEPVIKEGEDTYNKGLEQLKEGERQLEEGKKALEEGRRKYNEGLQQLKEAEEKLNAGKKELESKKKELEAGLAQLKAAYSEYESGLKLLNEGEAALRSGFAEYETNAAAFRDGKSQLESAKNEYLTKVSELEDGGKLLEDAKAQLESGKKEYEDGQAQYLAGESEYASGKTEYDEGLRKYNSGLAEYEQGRANFDEEIKKARAGLSEIDAPTWYVYDRTGYQTYNDFFDGAGSIRNLSTVFPIVFFLVAVLVSLTSMSRMVEMDRLEIGTLKSMGFNRETVITKYAFFSILATVTGSVIGSTLGLIILPTMIFNIYGILFEVPRLYLSPSWSTTLVGFSVVVAMVVGAGMLKAVQVMREKPADLLRPKAPKPGKRIFLERIEPLWRKVRFSDKITLRNLFRYKRRLFVTVFGITGCTALLLCGFGLKDAIVDIPQTQFEQVFRFGALSYMTGFKDSRQDSERMDRIFDEEEITGYLESMRINIKCDNYVSFIIAVKDAEEIEDTILLRDVKTGERVKPETGKVVITEKLAKLTGVNTGDEITFTDIDQVEYKYPVSGIVKNYFEHYIFMDKATLEEYKDYEPNLIFLRTKELGKEQKEDLASRLLKKPAVLNVIYKDKLQDDSKNMLKSLDSVVVIIIVMSAVLSFVVLYNLCNINIKERHREIATLKVLGFYDKEVDGYIHKENIIVTIIGIAAGLALGILLTKVVVSTVEIEKAMFINRIKPLSYVLSAAISAAFTLIVNGITHFTLKKINMIDSLKSVD